MFATAFPPEQMVSVREPLAWSLPLKGALPKKVGELMLDLAEQSCYTLKK